MLLEVTGGIQTWRCLAPDVCFQMFASSVLLRKETQGDLLVVGGAGVGGETERTP